MECQFDSGNMQRTCNSEKRIYVEFEATVLYDVKICTAGITRTDSVNYFDISILSLVGNSKKGIFFSDFRPEMLFTVWLTVIASVAMGFIISSVVQSGDKAMAAAPFVLIVQLLFSGILFTLKGAGKIISYCTVSRWSVEALGSIARLNKLDLRMQADFPMLEHEAESFFKATAGHVWTASGILILMTAVLMVVATLLLR